MTDAYDRYDFAEPVPMDMSWRDSGVLSIAVRRIEVTEDVILIADTHVDDVRRIAEHNLFHVHNELNMVEWFERDVELTLRLDRKIAATMGNGDAFLELLFGVASEEQQTLRSTASWFLLEAMQSIDVSRNAIADMSSGVRTRWASE